MRVRSVERLLLSKTFKKTYLHDKVTVRLRGE